MKEDGFPFRATQWATCAVCTPLDACRLKRFEYKPTKRPSLETAFSCSLRMIKHLN